MAKQIEEAEYVLIVASKSYWEKYNENNSEGINWEINIVYNTMYKLKCVTDKFIPVFWNEGDEKYILTPLMQYTHYNIGTEEGYTDLMKCLLGVPKYQKVKTGKIDIHKYDPLPSKLHRTMFFPTHSDLVKCNASNLKVRILDGKAYRVGISKPLSRRNRVTFKMEKTTIGL